MAIVTSHEKQRTGVRGEDFTLHKSDGWEALDLGEKITSGKLNDANGEYQYKQFVWDGIYLTSIIPKATLYCSNEGYAKGFGEDGWIFEVQARLGNPESHHESDVTWYKQGGQKIRSPEWAVLDHQGQINVVKMYKVKTAHVQAMDNFVRENLNEEVLGMPVDTFAAFLKEEESVTPMDEDEEPSLNHDEIYINWMDGLVWTATPEGEKVVSWDEIDCEEYGCTFEPAQHGVFMIKKIRPGSTPYTMIQVPSPYTINDGPTGDTVARIMMGELDP